MPKTVAVVTDATSPEFFFPKWHAYYGGVFGASQLYVLTYRGLHSSFREFDLGGLWEVPHLYSDPLRARVISTLVATLLQTHDVVVRCDVDEFLIPDPTFYNGLRDYVERLDAPYVTARGIDVLEERADEPLDIARPILNLQRRRAIRQSALNKTAITRQPLVWADGFHGCNASPVIGDLYLFHLKFADIKRRVAWFGHMHGLVASHGREQTYFSVDQDKLLKHQAWLLSLPELDGWPALVASGFDEQFVADVTRNQGTDIYAGPFRTGNGTFRIPSEFTGVI